MRLLHLLHIWKATLPKLGLYLFSLFRLLGGSGKQGLALC
jgi:hypothetical protein